jgi:transposase
MFWVLSSGAPWRDLPERYGPWKTVYGRFRRWSQSGLFRKGGFSESAKRFIQNRHARGSRGPGAKSRPDRFRVFGGGWFDCASAQERGGRTKKRASAEESLQQQELGRSRGGFSTKLHLLCEGAGLPIIVQLTPGQAHESSMLAPLLDHVSIAGKPGPPRRRFEVVAGDKGYDGAALRAAILSRGSRPLIPSRRRRDGSSPERAAGFDQDAYKRRNVVERLFGRLKEHRRIATRYDKLAASFKAFVILGCVRIWLENLL